MYMAHLTNSEETFIVTVGTLLEGMATYCLTVSFALAIVMYAVGTGILGFWSVAVKTATPDPKGGVDIDAVTALKAAADGIQQAAAMMQAHQVGQPPATTTTP